MSSKLNLEVGRGNGFNEQNRFAVKFDIKNYDTSAVALSGLRVVAYSWLQYRNILSQFTSGTNSQGTLSQFTSAIDPMNGVGQTGIVNLNLTGTTYRVYHNIVDSSKIAPQLTLNAPNGSNSYATVISYDNSTDTYFDIVINEVLPTPGYSVTWFLPGSYDAYTGSTTNIGSPNLTIEKVPEYIRVKNRKYDSRFIFSWTGNTNLINPNWGLKDTDVYVQLNPTLFPSSNITSAWYSSLSDNVLEDNPYFVLEQWNGSSWQVVQEYLTSGTLDNLTGTISTDPNFIKIVNTGSGNNKSVYISPTNINPISANSSDKNNLSLWSKSSGDNRRRSLVKFETSTLPSSATGIKNAILRLNVNSLSNAWNHFSTNGHISVHRVTTDWNENEANWSNRKIGIPWLTSGGDYDTTPAIWVGNSELSNSFTSADQNKQFWVDFDISSIVDYWRIHPTENYGLLVKLYDSSNENNSTTIKWELNSGRLAGTGSISAFPQLLVSYNTLNTSGAIPTVEIKSPETNSNIFNSTFSISGTSNISFGQVEVVDVYYRPASSILPYQYFGTLNNNGVNSWNSIFNSLTVGSYDFKLRAISDLGDYGESSLVRLNFQTKPSITLTADSICHNGSINLNGSIDLANGTPIAGTVSYVKTFIPTDKKITSIVEDRISSGVVWVSTDGNGLYRIDKNSTTNRVVSFNTSNSSISYDYINDMSMDSQGILWISYTGNGIGVFDSKNWSIRNSNDWYLYNSSNSSLSAYPANSIDICDIHIDANDNKWFSLTYQTTNSVLKLSGYSFNDSFTTKYNLNISPRRIVSRGSYVYVATSDDRIFKYDGITWNNYSLPTFNTINDIGIDTNDVLWIATDDGFASLNGTTFTELYSSATNSWEYGLNSGKGKSQNVQAKSVYVGSNNWKWFSYSTGINGEFNGGVVKYTSDTINQTGIDNNLSVIDSHNYSGILSNNVLKTIVATDNYVWVATDKGLCNLNGTTWENFSKDIVSSNIILSAGSWASVINNPLYGNNEYVVDFEYSSGEHYSSSFNISSVQTPSITITSPNEMLNTIPSNSYENVISYNIPNNDAKSGGNVSVSVKKSPNQYGPWYEHYLFENQLDYSIYETLSPEDFYYVKIDSLIGSCSAESDVYAIYGNNVSTVYVNPLTGQHYSNEALSFTGTVHNKDFSRTLNVNGSSYVDSLESVEFGYVTSAGFVSVGFANISPAINSSASFSFEWNSPIVGVSSLSAITTTKYGTVGYSSVSFNAIASKPTITILSPLQNQTVPLLSNFVLSASTSYLTNSVSALNFYISNNSSVSSIGSATSAGNGLWTKSISPSSYGSGGYSISATCVDVVNVSAISNPTTVYFNFLPTVSQISNLTETHTGTYSFQIKINDTNNFYNNKIEIISAGSVYTSGHSNGFGDFEWNWVNPPNGSISLSAKIYDGNPTTSSDYIIYPFVLNLNKISVSISAFSYPSARFNGIVISPKVNVVTTDTLISPVLNVTGSNVSGTTYWLCNYDFSTSSYYKESQLSASFYLPSSREFITPTTSRYHFWGILAETFSTNGSSIESDLAYFYVKEQSISGDIFNSVCSNPLVFSGEFLDSDLPYNSSNFIIDNEISTRIFDETHGTTLGYLTRTNRTSENVPFVYSWSNPSSSVSAVSFRIVDAYGISASQIINYGGLDVDPEIYLASAGNYIANSYGVIYLVSAGNYSVSAITSATKIKDLYFRYFLDDGNWYNVSANNKTGIIPIPQTSSWVTVQAYVKTSGNCEAYSDAKYYITLDPISANIYPDNCSTCYCNGGRLKITGNLVDGNFQKYSLINSFGRSISAYLYDSSNNLISDITSQVSAGNNSFETYWETPTIGTSSIYLKVVDNNNVVQIVSKDLVRSIYESPYLELMSPVDYSISGTIYKQDNSIYFSTNVSSTDLLGVKYYVNGELKATQNNPSNGFLYDWNSDKLPGMYLVSAVAINSNGCYSVASRNIMVVNSPSTNFIYPVSGNYYQVGSLLSASVDSKGNSPASVSAVSVKFAGSSFNASYNNVTRTWDTTLSAISSASSVYSLSAYSYDTLGQVTIKEIKINASTAPIFQATVSGSTNVSANYNTLLPINVSGYSTNGGFLSSSYMNISGTTIQIPNVSSNAFYGEILIPLYFVSGNNVVNVFVSDTVGAISSQQILVYVNPYTGIVSYPIIKNVGSDPINKITYRS